MDIREQLFSKPLPSNRTAYKKAIKAAKEIAGMFCMSDKMLLTISYIFEQMQEVTPLALQKILYFIQGIYMVMFDKPLYKEDCMAWVHGYMKKYMIYLRISNLIQLKIMSIKCPFLIAYGGG